MFDRCTDNAKRTFNEARRHSQRLNHDFLGTEHILLGLLDREGCHARALLGSLQIAPDRVRAEIDKLIRPGPSPATSGQLPFTPRAKKALEFSLEEAELLGSRVIGTEHLLLGLARETEGVASKALSACGFSIEKTRALAREQMEPESSAHLGDQSLTGSGDPRLEAYRLRVLEDAVKALAVLQEFELAAKVRDVARRHGSRM